MGSFIGGVLGMSTRRIAMRFAHHRRGGTGDRSTSG